MSSSDYEPVASFADSDMADDYTFSRASSEMTTPHDNLLARCHSGRSSRLEASAPKLMCWLDCEPSESLTDSDMIDDHTFVQDSFEPIECLLPTIMEVIDEPYILHSTHDNLLARCHSARSSRVGSNKRQKLMSSFE